ncbi:MAG: THUMP domain-containing protein [Brumimicrobium sp.]|nr:THUMP domain-containing protein [Brumimicrobium sp.]
MEKLKITVKTLYNFEDILQDELSELGYQKTEKLNRAVQLTGNWEDVYRLNFRCRLAISVLVEVASFHIRDEKDLYNQAKKIAWTEFFDLEKTFAVKGAVFSTLFTHTQYPFLLVKDAIADVFREKYDARPNVNIKAPQVMFDVYVREKAVTISLNTSGIPLFQRGYRQEVGEAPMNEVLAAGLLRLAGWDRKSTFVDPMCGSGTIAIEAALWAADIPAMIERQHYAFKNFRSFDAEAWERVQGEVNRRPKDLGFEILAFDADAGMVQKAKRNSRMAPIGNMVTFEVKNLFDSSATTEEGLLICNPPYGERMGESEEITDFYKKLGDTFKNAYTGYDCWVVSSNVDAIKNIGLKPNEKYKVYNGSLECSFRKFKVFEGSIKTASQADTPDSDRSSSTLSESAYEKNKEAETVDRAEKIHKKKISEKVDELRSGTSKYKPVHEPDTKEVKHPAEREKKPSDNTRKESQDEEKEKNTESLSLKEKIAKMKKYRSRE